MASGQDFQEVSIRHAMPSQYFTQTSLCFTQQHQAGVFLFQCVVVVEFLRINDGNVSCTVLNRPGFCRGSGV